MKVRPSLWLAALVVCTVPALGISMPHGGVVATFFPACPGTHVAPTVRKRWTTDDRPSPCPKSTLVTIYTRGMTPPSGYRVIGTVSVVSHSSETQLIDLRQHAQRAAREMGGDALVDLYWDDAAHARAGELGKLCLTANVARR
jgi:hypothetical protein